MVSGIFKAAALCAVFLSQASADIADIDAASALGLCKCSPADHCWPKASAWKSLNSTVGGKLIQSEPPAIVCYPGPSQDLAACAQIVSQLTNSTFIGDNPIALDYPILDGCRAVNYAAGEVPGNCSIGDSPLYTVNATSAADIQKTINFARQRGIRLVVRNTGHDITGRSTGYGSLQVWIRHLRDGITFHKAYTTTCKKQTWRGSAFTVAGGYVWSDVYSEAAARKLVVVGGGDPTVGVIGGWAQGGGHSPANHDFGLGSDQILEAKVVLANGRLVTANPCENSDLFFAIRGGGGGTYGVVVSTIVKAHPTAPYSAQVVAMAPYSDADMPEFMEALAIMYESLPAMNDGGMSGYGSWSTRGFAPVVESYTSGYNHALAAANKSIADLEAIWAPVAARLAPFNVFLSTAYHTYPDYVSYYTALSGEQMAVGNSAALGSRMLDKPALANAKGLRAMLAVTAGETYDFAQNNYCLVGGGQVAADAADTFSGVNPTWRSAVLVNIVARGWQAGTPAAEQQAVRDDITFVKTKSMRAIAPNTGGYMNEGDRNAPTFLKDFYGGSLRKLQLAKLKYDPLAVFYCPTCVGSEYWAEDATGRLCFRAGL